MKVVGDIRCSGSLLLEGRVDGSFIGAELVVAESGEMSGTVSSQVLECYGHIDGDVLTGSLKLGRNGRQRGTVTASRLEVARGAVLDCVLQSGTSGGGDGGGGSGRVGVDLKKLLPAFLETNRPCCCDVPWSVRSELYKQLQELLRKGKPLVRVMGEAGSGKSVLLEKLYRHLPRKWLPLYLEEQVGSVSSLLQILAEDLGVADGAGPAHGELLARIAQRLEEEKKQGRRPVLLIDDVQRMYPATLEGIIHQLSSAFGEVGEEGLLQIILFGTPEMKTRMVPTILEYFEDETNCLLELEPLNFKDTADYLRLGLQLAAGGDGQEAVSVFPNETIKEIHVRSRGSIAEVNHFAGKALQNGCVANVSVIAPRFV